jgi:hypothetical protein
MPFSLSGRTATVDALHGPKQHLADRRDSMSRLLCLLPAITMPFYRLFKMRDYREAQYLSDFSVILQHSIGAQRRQRWCASMACCRLAA